MKIKSIFMFICEETKREGEKEREEKKGRNLYKGKEGKRYNNTHHHCF